MGAPAPAQAVQMQQKMVNDMRDECLLQGLRQGNIEAWRRLLTDTSVSQHSNSAYRLPSVEGLIRSREQMQCSKQQTGVDTVSSLGSVPELTRTVDSLAVSSLG